jgi:hypothetical protein
MISVVQHRTYSRAAEAPVVRRLSDRFRDPRQRPGLTALFRIDDAGLDELVELCYRQHLEYDRNRFWDGLPTSFLVQEGAED